MENFSLMQSGIDSQGINQGPLQNSRIWLSLYFIAFLVTISFFFLNLFVGMIIFTFQQKSAKIEGELDRNSVRFVISICVLLNFK